MKYFTELTHDQQEQILDELIAGPLFSNMKDDLRQLLGVKCYVFDANLKMHVLGAPTASDQ